MAVAFDQTGASVLENTSAAWTWTHTITGSVTNGYLLVAAENFSDDTLPTSVTWGSTTLLQIGAGIVDATNGLSFSMWGAATGSTTGAATVTVNWAAAKEGAGTSDSFSGVLQAPVNYQQTEGTSSPTSTTLACPTNGMVCCGLGAYVGGSPVTPTAEGTVDQANIATGGVVWGLEHTTNNTQTWTESAGTVHAMAVISVALSASAGPASYKSVILEDSPVAYWRLDEPTATTAYDQTANANNGTYTGGYTLNTTPGALTGSGDLDACVALNGTSGYVSGADVSGLDVTTNFSLEVWVKPSTAIPATDVYFMSKATEATPSTFNLYAINTAIYFVVGSSGNDKSYAISTGVWTHIVATCNGTTGTLYANGVSLGTFTVGTAASTPGTPVILGANYAIAEFFEGDLDEVAIYGYTLSATQVLNHYLAGTLVGPLARRPSRMPLGV